LLNVAIITLLFLAAWQKSHASNLGFEDGVYPPAACPPKL